jgi:hypothetical protein
MNLVFFYFEFGNASDSRFLKLTGYLITGLNLAVGLGMELSGSPK